MNINPITLKYDDFQLERSFRQDYAKKSIKQVRFAILLPIIIYFLVTILDVIQLLRGVYTYDYMEMNLWIKFGIFTPLLVVIFAFTYTKKIFQVMQPALIVVSLISAVSFPIAISSGVSLIRTSVAGQNYDYILFIINTALVLVTLYTYTGTRLLFTYSTATALVIFIIYNITAFYFIRPTLFGITIGTNFQLLIANLIGGSAGYLMELYLRRDFLKSFLIETEREKSEQLLLNILPRTIASRLKESNDTIADSFNSVTILFADIVDFTRLSSQVSPVELVEILNYIFSAFDELAEKHQLEKIKTIGDAYMVVGGIPEPRIDHAEAIAEMALDMQAEILKINQKSQQNFSMRIGINSGEVVAGVIGKKKFIYDLWGDAVNTASRMESHGVPNAIHVTIDTYNLLADKYLFEERGVIEVKGQGEIQTYFLKDRLAVNSRV
jgi:class 3 adenylate cyclase